MPITCFSWLTDTDSLNHPTPNTVAYETSWYECTKGQNRTVLYACTYSHMHAHGNQESLCTHNRLSGYQQQILHTYVE
jgi:hypothetical protein